MATDIAFAVGVIALLGDRFPGALKVFLLTLAIVDDLGAIIVIAVLYCEAIHWDWFGLALVLIAAPYILKIQAIHPWTSFVIIPVFALANAGI